MQPNDFRLPEIAITVRHEIGGKQLPKKFAHTLNPPGSVVSTTTSAIGWQRLRRTVG
jgi:hypothetical protein